MDDSFSGKVALVTGAGSGIGRATAMALAGRGARVVVADAVVSGGEETVRLIGEGGRAIFVRADVSRSQDVEDLIGQTVRAYGRLDLAANVAGVHNPVLLPLAEDNEEEFDRTIGINLKGVWLCLKFEIIQMLRTGGGSIVNVASTAGLNGAKGMAIYSASKHGVIGLTRTAALDYGRAGIRVNAVCPGPTWTPMMDRLVSERPNIAAKMAAANPSGRIGTAEEVADVIVWLCSSTASFVNGQAIPVDGGGSAS